MEGHLVIGGNLGDRRARLQAGVDALADHGVLPTACSSLYETDPVGPVADQPPYLNAALKIETKLDPDGLLTALKAIERAAGRITDPAAPGYIDQGPRPLDLDIVLLGTLTIDNERLTVPHPRLPERRFALIPLLELDIDLASPTTGPLASALAQLPLEQGVRRVDDALALPLA